MDEARSRRRLAALLMADVVGYSRLVDMDEAGTVARVNALRRDLLEPAIAARGGRLVKSLGDGFLVEFGSIVDAVACAVEFQQRTTASPAMPLDAASICLRMGVHVGDVLIDGDDLLGDGVNVVARLEGVAEPGGVVLSADAFRHVENRLPHLFEDAGEHALKNIARPLRVYRWRRTEPSSPAMSTPLPLPDKPSIAVLPFTNMSGDPEQEYFVDGMVEDIITALSRIRWLFVIARNSSFTYKGKAVDIKQVGRDLGVRYVLEGSVRKAGNRVRITGQLIDATNGAHIWADRFDRELTDIFELQDEVTQNVVNAIEPNLRAVEIARGRRKPTQSLDAHDLYLRAQPLIEIQSEPAFHEAIALLQRAIEIDPNYSDAWASLSDSLGRLAFQWPLKYEGQRTSSCDAALRAVELDPQNGTALSLAAWALSSFARRYDEATDLANRALALHPNSAFVQANCAIAFVRNAEFEKGIEHADLALRMNPANPRIHFVLNTKAAAHLFSRRFESAVQIAEQSLARVPTHIGPLRLLVAGLFYLGRMDAAQAMAARLMASHPDTRAAHTFAFGHQWMMDFMRDGLRGAGVPE